MNTQRQVPCGNEVIDAVYDFFLFKHFKQINFISYRITSTSMILSKVEYVCNVIFFFTLEEKDLMSLSRMEGGAGVLIY